MSRFIDMTGDTFGKWLVVGPYKREGRRTMWFCKCTGCNETEQWVEATSLRSGGTNSCRQCGFKVTGAKNSTHGKSNSAEYKVYHGMVKRIEKENQINYERYGGRGIKISPEWRDSFEQFLEDMGPRPSPDYQLERIDNEGDYCKENCVWKTIKENCRNRRSNLVVEMDGKSQCLIEWAEEFNVNYKSLWHLYRTKGLDLRIAINKLKGV